jgi:hypothetical protein
LIGLVAATLLLPGCGGSADTQAPSLAKATDDATFASLVGVGSHHLQASVKRVDRARGSERVSAETMELRWKDPDHWSFVTTRAGKPQSQVVVWDGEAWSGRGGGALERRRDAEPYRVQLQTLWDPWKWGLDNLGDRIQLEPADIEVVEGRRAQRFNLTLPPAPPKPPRGWSPSRVSGSIWVDEATAVRLKGDVVLTLTSGESTREITLLFLVRDIGADPGVSPPIGDKR